MATFLLSLGDTEDVSVQTGADSPSSSESDAEAVSDEEVAKRPRYALKGLVQQTSAGATNNQFYLLRLWLCLLLSPHR